MDETVDGRVPCHHPTSGYVGGDPPSDGYTDVVVDVQKRQLVALFTQDEEQRVQKLNISGEEV